MISNILTVLSFLILLLSAVIDCNFLSRLLGVSSKIRKQRPSRPSWSGGFHASMSQASTSMLAQLKEDIIKHDLKDLVCSSVEETLNALFDKEADELVNAEKYEQSFERQCIVLGM